MLVLKHLIKVSHSTLQTEHRFWDSGSLCWDPRAPPQGCSASSVAVLVLQLPCHGSSTFHGEPREKGREERLQERTGGFWTSGMKAINLKVDPLEKGKALYVTNIYFKEALNMK